MTSRGRDADSSQAVKRQPRLAEFHTSRYIGGLTHDFYRYPATTSPDLVRELLLSHTDADDLVLDPFMGGGTTIVESLAHGRRAVGGDVNSLAVFVTRAKATPMTESEWEEISAWLDTEPLRSSIDSMEGGAELKLPRKLYLPIARALAGARVLRTSRQENVIRCALLRTSQWALESSYLYPRDDDRRNETPSPDLLEAKLRTVLARMRAGMAQLVEAAGEHGVRKADFPRRRWLVRGAAEDLRAAGRLAPLRGKVDLVLTSPPYPSVHVLYHRWQIEGRRETAAPYWIAGTSDGATSSYYTMGSRTAFGQDRYFERLQRAFGAFRPFLRREARVLQVVAFNRAEEQLPRYLAAMERAGYRACHGREGPLLVRDVPNRRWYARGNNLDAGREHLLIHAID